MTETTTITTPYPPTSEIICALINRGWCIDSVELNDIQEENGTYIYSHWTIKAHAIAVETYGEFDKNQLYVFDKDGKPVKSDR